MTPAGVLETCLYADDLEAAAAFYTGVLGLTVVGREAGRHVFFRCGASMLLVFNPHRCRADGASDVPRHGSVGPGHVALAVAEADVDPWLARLAELGIPVEQVITRPAGRSVYFRDPAGNSVELVTPAIWGLASA
jgi:catechol 2,3-dioxygenase-like lactoylglutathione lyase family enzyme